MSAIDKACKVVGGQVQMAKMLEVTPQAVNQWVLKNKVPADRALSVESACNCEVTRYDLRPDIYGDAPDQAAA